MENSADRVLPSPVVKLLQKGVRMPEPFSVDIGPEVNPERISGDGVVFFGGTRLRGARTLISSGVQLGGETPVTVADCLLGRGVELKGGVFKDSVFLERANMGSGAQVREGCLLEEEANGSHTVGIKQTILFPFVTLGSLINFCDCFLAGGTSRKNHSEVGSSYIHFNYTPNQDKATASLLGDVPRGVMLREAPIFLGGQGGIVGPLQIGYGTVIAAGTIWRRDCPEGGKLLKGDAPPLFAGAFHPGLYGDIRRRVVNNIAYLANLFALRLWYLHARRLVMPAGELGEALHCGALAVLEAAIKERLSRFEALAQKMAASRVLAEKHLSGTAGAAILRRQAELQERWPAVKGTLTEGSEATVDLEGRDLFLEKLAAAGRGGGPDHVRVIQSLDPQTATQGTRWLQRVVEAVQTRTLAHLPACRE